MAAVCIIFWLVGLCAVVVSMRREVQMAQCGNCGYELAGLPPVGTCPECGREYLQAVDRAVWVAGFEWRRGWWALVLLGPSLVVAVIPALEWRVLFLAHGYPMELANKVSFGGIEVQFWPRLWAMAAGGLGVYLCSVWVAHRAGIRAAVRFSLVVYVVLTAWLTAVVGRHWISNRLYWVFEREDLWNRSMDISLLGLICSLLVATTNHAIAEYRRVPKVGNAPVRQDSGGGASGDN